MDSFHAVRAGHGKIRFCMVHLNRKDKNEN